MFQPADRGANYLLEGGELIFEMFPSGSSEGIGLPPVGGLDGANPAVFFEARDGSIERSGPKPESCELPDILHDRVAVFIPIGQAGKYEQSWI